MTLKGYNNERIEKKYYILEVDKIENLSFVGFFVINEDYHFKVKVSYQDLLLNYYEQEIDFSYKLTPYTNNSDRIHPNELGYKEFYLPVIEKELGL